MAERLKARKAWEIRRDDALVRDGATVLSAITANRTHPNRMLITGQAFGLNAR